MKKSYLFLLFILPLFLIAQPRTTRPQQSTVPATPKPPSGKIIGSIFSDYLYVVQEPQVSVPSSGTDGRNEFDVRRAAFGYDHSFSRDVNALVMVDASSGLLQQGFINIRNLITQIDLKMGKMQTLSSETVEKVWHYRSLDATALDKAGFTDEFDNGVTFTSRTDANGTSYARLAAYNGTGGTETDKIKKYGLALGSWLDQSSVIEMYADYENVGSGRSTITGKIFYGMSSAKYAFGFEGFYRMNRKFAGTKDMTPVGGSLFTWFELMSNVRAVARLDGMDNDLNNSNVGYREVNVNIGLDYMPAPDVHLIPNIVYAKQLKKGSTAVNADVIIARLTAAVSFSAVR
jgi:hypothetical protein